MPTTFCGPSGIFVNGLPVIRFDIADRTELIDIEYRDGTKGKVLGPAQLEAVIVIDEIHLPTFRVGDRIAISGKVNAKMIVRSVEHTNVITRIEAYSDELGEDEDPLEDIRRLVGEACKDDPEPFPFIG